MLRQCLELLLRPQGQRLVLHCARLVSRQTRLVAPQSPRTIESGGPQNQPRMRRSRWRPQLPLQGRV